MLVRGGRMVRSPWMALIMAIIPFVGIYLLYKWWDELKAAGKSDKDPIVWTILGVIPIVQLYALYVLFSTADDAAKAARKEGYMLGVIPMYILGLLLFIPLLYMIYKTQAIFNECGI